MTSLEQNAIFPNAKSKRRQNTGLEEIVIGIKITGKKDQEITHSYFHFDGWKEGRMDRLTDGSMEIRK